MINSDSSLKEFQLLNKEIYLVVNDRGYSNIGLFSRLHRHITKILKAVRKENYENIEYHLSMSFSWALALFNRLHIDLADEMWKAFPGCCPYCLDVPCACKKRPKERQKLQEKLEGKQPISMFEWQKMFAGIYPNIVINSAIHLSEEAGEVDEAITIYSATHIESWFRKTVQELIDVVTNIFGVANCLNINLALELAGYFDKGCPKCHKSPCNCGYVTDDESIPLKSCNIEI